MNPNYIRPIPKRLEKRILTYDAKHGCNRGLRFYAYLNHYSERARKDNRCSPQ